MSAPNEKILYYRESTPERANLEKALAAVLKGGFDIPLVIGGKEIRTGNTAVLAMPDDLSKNLGVFHRAGRAEALAAIEAARAARPDWAASSFETRAAVFRKAADLVSGKYRPLLVAATMLGQGKTAYQAEIDAACETADFFRLNPEFAETLRGVQPVSVPNERNTMIYRALEGFVYAVSPFNFTAIAANLAAAPALMGNVVVWKPASTSVLSNWILMKIYEEAGLPPGVVNFLPGSGADISSAVFSSRDFAGLHFTGSTPVLNSMWKTIAESLDTYATYPRIVGETGGKGFVFVDPSADPDVALAAVLRGAYEYQGQKCSAASRLYIPNGMAKSFIERLAERIASLPVGKVSDFGSFMSAVIDRPSFDNIMSYIARAKASDSASIRAGGNGDPREGYFIEPTLILEKDPKGETMREEIFGPVLSAYVYDEGKMEEAYSLVDSTSPYGLTGAIIARDEKAADAARRALCDSAGNLYINDSPTGALVGRQPFGGMRASGTNDKSGSLLNLARWTSPCAVKENLDPSRDWRRIPSDDVV